MNIIRTTTKVADVTAHIKVSPHGEGFMCEYNSQHSRERADAPDYLYGVGFGTTVAAAIEDYKRSCHSRAYA